MLDVKTISAQLEHITNTTHDISDFELAQIMKMTVDSLNRMAGYASQREIMVGYRVVDPNSSLGGFPSSKLVVSIMTEIA